MRVVHLLQLLFPDICKVILMLFDQTPDFEVCGYSILKRQQSTQQCTKIDFLVQKKSSTR